jgi:hypothetical protein
VTYDTSLVAALILLQSPHPAGILEAQRVEVSFVCVCVGDELIDESHLPSSDPAGLPQRTRLAGRRSLNSDPPRGA